MNSIFNFLFSRKSLMIFGAISALVFIASMYNRYVYIDDAWFGEQAYWLASDGIVKAVSVKGFFAWDEHLLTFHRLPTIIGAGLIKIFGWSVTPLRAFTLVLLTLFSILLAQYIRKRKSLFANDDWMIALSLMILNPLLVLYGYTFRPEILVMFLGFASYVLLDIYLSHTKKIIYVILAGLLAGLAFLAHINGMIFGMAGAVLLLSKKMIRPMLLFSVSTAITASMYFYELLPSGNLDAFLYQLANWPVPHGSSYLNSGIGGYVFSVLKKLSEEHMRFFWSHRVWGFSSMFLLILFSNVRYFSANHRQLLVYLLALILCLNIFGSNIAERYVLLFLPYMILIMILGIRRLRDQDRSIVKGLVLVTFAVYILGLVLGFVDIFSRSKDFVAEHERVMAEIPKTDEAILVNYAFIFNELEKRNLVSYKTFEYHQVKLGSVYSQDNFFAKSDSLQIAYIIVPPDMTIGDDNRFPFLCDGIIDDNPWYDVYFQDSEYLILKRK